MATPCFYYANLDALEPEVELSPEESAHALQSRRLGVGTPIKLIDGKGGMADAVISSVSKRVVHATVGEFATHSARRRPLTLAVAMPKGDRQKVMVDMLTQQGIQQLIPLRCERSISSLRPNHLEKLRRVALEACKQSHNPTIPNIAEPRAFDDVLASSDALFYADIDGKNPREINLPDQPVTILVGPEGGFSDRELLILKEKKAQSFSLGGNILRTETAAITAAGWFSV